MHDPRTSPALRSLAGLTGEAVPCRWAWSVRRLDGAGRVCLARPIVEALGPCPWRQRWHHLALIVEPGFAGDGVGPVVDNRGRLAVPMWLRRLSREVLVGLDTLSPRLLVAPIEVLDRLGDFLSGGR